MNKALNTITGFTKTVMATSILAVTLTACTSGEERKAQYLERAETHFASGNLEKATVDVRNALQIDEEYIDARFLFARIHELDQNWEQMVANLRFILDRDPNHHVARLKLGAVMLAARAHDRAMEAADETLALDPENAEAYALKGAVHFRQGENDLAIAAAEKALSFVPTNTSAISVLTEVYKAENPELALQYIEQGIAGQDKSGVLQMLQIQVFEASGEMDKAAEIYEKLISEQPDNLYYYYRYITMLEANGNTARGEELLRGLTASQPEKAELKMWLTQYLVNHSDLEVAEQTLRDFVAANPDDPDLSLGLSQLLAAQGKLDDAATHLMRNVETGEDSELAQRSRYALALIYSQTDRQTEADAMIDEMLEVEPENPDALLLRARQALADRDFDRAIAQSRQVLRSRADSKEAMQLQALAHEGKGLNDLAIDNYRQLLTLDPQNEVALIKLATHANLNGEQTEAIELASAALRVNSSNTAAARVLVAAYAQSGQTERALDEASMLKDESNSNLMGEFMLARVYHFDNQFEQAATAYEDVLQKEPRVVEALQGLVQTYVQLDRQEDARNYLNNYIATNDNHGHALQLLGALDEAEGDRDAAQTTYAKATEAFPGQPANFVRLGDLNVKRGRLDKALEAYREGLSNHPQDPALNLRLAQILEQMGQLDEAITQYEQVLVLSPDSIIARNNIAVLYSDHAPSQENLNRAISLMRGYATRTEPALLDTLGWVYYRLGEAEQAVQYLSKATANGGDDPTIHYHLGVALMETGQSAKARTALQDALERNNKLTWAEDARRRLAEI